MALNQWFDLSRSPDGCSILKIATVTTQRRKRLRLDLSRSSSFIKGDRQILSTKYFEEEEEGEE
jgi:hypothetical protein